MDVPSAEAVAFSEVEREVVEWLVDGRIPRGMVTLLAGDPGLGKSMLTVSYAADVSRDGHAVLLLTAEDSPAATVRPRLEAVEADLELVHYVRLKRNGIEDGLLIPDNVDELDRLVGEHEARLVVIDPLMAHLSEMVNSWRDQSVRLALAPLYHLADRHGAAVVVVLHLNKTHGGSPMMRIGGSVGIPGAVRSALLFARDPDDPDGDEGRQRVLAHIKCNVGPEQPSLLYEIQPVQLPATSEQPEVETARVRLVGESVHNGHSLLNGDDDEERTAVEEAEDFLRQELGEGPRPASEVQKLAREAGIAERTLRRARNNLCNKPVKSGFGQGWEWSLKSTLPEGGQGGWPSSESAEVGHLRENGSTMPVSAPPRGPESAEGGQTQILATLGAEEGASVAFQGNGARGRGRDVVELEELRVQVDGRWIA